MPEPESFLDRIVRIFRQKAAARVRQADDPAEAIDVLIGEQLTAIANARADLTRVASAEKRLEMLVAEFDQRRAKYDEAIRAAAPDDARARTDARRSLECERNAAEGRAHGAEVSKQRAALAETIEDMRAQYDRLRMRREATNALATAARASVQSQESMTPLGPEGADRERFLDAARESLAQLRARAAALADLRDSGSLDAVGAGEFDDRQRIPDVEVDRKLAELRG